MLALALVWLANIVIEPDNAGISDVGVYFDFGTRIEHGAVPYRDFAVEYPPLSLLLFWLPALVADTFDGYEKAIGWLLLPFGWAVQVAGARLAPARGDVVAWGVVALPIVFGTLVRERFDIAPTAVALFAVLALAGDCPRAGFALIGVGAALKLFPLVLAGPAAAWLVARGRAAAARSGAVVCVAVMAALCLPLFAASPSGFVDQFEFHLDRPIQIESSPATALFALGGSSVTGAPGSGDNRFRSQGLDGGADEVVGVLFALLQLAAYAALVVFALRATRRARGDVVAERRVLVLSSLAALLVFAALGKVLSPQYMLWLAPFLLLAWIYGERTVATLGAVACFLTSAYFPRHYFDLVARDDLLILTVAARNILLLAALAMLLRNLSPRPYTP